jgi:prophage tail gpP-like protein
MMASDFTLQLNGVTYTNFESISVRRDMESISGSFSFASSTLSGGNFPVKRGTYCVASIGKHKLISGYVDEIDVSYTKDSHSITIKGRDKTQDIIDSTIDASIQIIAPISLEGVIKKVLDYLGITDIKIINQVKDLTPFQKGDLVSAEVGQKAFDFLDQYCRKQAVFLTADGEGNIIITRGEGIQTNGQLVGIVGNTGGNNIKEASVNYNDSQRFYSYNFKSQVNTVSSNSLNSSVDVKNIVYVNAQVTDDEVRKTRKFVKKSEKSATQSVLQDRALWERNIRGARSAKFSAVVYGHYLPDQSDIWRPLQIVRVTDDFCNVKDDLIIVSAEYMLDIPSGSLTRLELAPKIAYNLRPEKPTKKKKADNTEALPNFDFNTYASQVFKR